MQQNPSPEKSSSFGPAFLFLPAAKREALAAVYGFCRAVDDVADEPSASDPQKELDFWKEEVARLYSGRPASPVGKRLLRAMAPFGLEREHFLLVVEGVELDLRASRYRTFEELERYMYRVASAVGFLCISIFGYRHGGTRDYAKYLGYAVQLTNILRDVAEDAARGRIYLPLEDMAKFGVEESDIAGGKYTPAMRALLEFEARRARSFYEKARACLDKRDASNMFAAEVMGCVYETLLGNIEKSGYNVFAGRISTSRLQKAGCLFKAWRRT